MEKSLKTRMYKISLLFMLLLVSCMPISRADDINPDQYASIYNPSGISDLNKMGGNILSVVQVVGTSIAVIMTLVIGIKYMLSAPDQKADIKSRLVPYLIGAILLFGASNLLAFFVEIVRKILK